MAGTYNIAGDGVMLLSQAVRRLRKPTVPLARPAVGGVAAVLKSARMADFSPEQLGFLTFGRGIDTTRMRSDARLRAGVHHRADLRRLRLGTGSRGPLVERSSRVCRLVAPADAPEAAVGDAEIIPIGTGGRPGRGSGSAPPLCRLAHAGAAAPRTPAPRPPYAHVKRRAGAGRDEVRPAGHGSPDRAPGGRRSRRPSGWRRSAPGAVQVFGDDWEPQLARFLAFLRRRLTGEYAVDEYGFDQEVAEKLLLASLRPIAEKWFRIEVRGVENLPAEGGALVVSNHSGTLPVDGLMTMVTIHDHTGRFLRPLGADLVFRLPVVSSLARKGGATLACNEDAERMLAGGELVGRVARGVQGHRQAVQRAVQAPALRPGRVRRRGHAHRRTHRAAVGRGRRGDLPAASATSPSLARLLGVPYVPITPLFPWLGPLGLVPLPSKWLLEFGEPIRTDEYDAGAADDPMLVFNVTDQVRETIQQSLYSLLRERTSVWH